jgi:hypothetical protein
MVASEPRRIVFGINATISGFSTLQDYPRHMWAVARVVAASRHGLTVRASDTEVNGLIHPSNIPQDLLASLRNRALKLHSSTTSSKAVSDVERLFHVGDIVRVRVASVSLGDCKVDFTMLPPSLEELCGEDDVKDVKASITGRESDKELIELDAAIRDKRRHRAVQKPFDGESTLLWWNGAPFVSSVKPAEGRDPDELTEQELEAFDHDKILSESKDMVRGKWLRELEEMAAADTKKHTKSQEAYLRDIDEEIGPLQGIHEALRDPLNLGIGTNTERFGYYLNEESARWLAGLQADEQTESMDDEDFENSGSIDSFYAELDRAAKVQEKILRGGMKGDIQRLQALVNKLNLERELKKPIKRESKKPISQNISSSPEAKLQGVINDPNESASVTVPGTEK